jgi:TM2 domain-containing membrane protein YozV
MFCKTCGEQINDMAEICPKCGVRAQPIIEPVKRQARERKSSGTAAILSFFIPGLGQLYVGEFMRGLCFCIGVFFSILLMSIGIGFILAPLIWFLSIYDAYKTAERTHFE